MLGNLDNARKSRNCQKIQKMLGNVDKCQKMQTNARKSRQMLENAKNLETASKSRIMLGNL